MPLRRSASKQKRVLFFLFASRTTANRGANSNDVVVIITSWRMRAHGNFDLSCIALRRLLAATENACVALQYVACKFFKQCLINYVRACIALRCVTYCWKSCLIATLE